MPSESKFPVHQFHDKEDRDAPEWDSDTHCSDVDSVLYYSHDSMDSEEETDNQDPGHIGGAE